MFIKRRIERRRLGFGHPKASANDAELHYVTSRSLGRAHAALLADRQLRAAWGIQPGVRSAHAFDDVWDLLEQIRTLDGFAELTDALGRFREILQPAVARRFQRRGKAG